MKRLTFDQWMAVIRTLCNLGGLAVVIFNLWYMMHHVK